MLLGDERRVMDVIYNKAGERRSFLITPNDFLRLFKHKKITKTKLDSILKALEMDDYIDIVYSTRRGETLYCITLHGKGKAYKRSGLNAKRDIAFKIILTAVLAVLSFLITVILRSCTG